MPQKSKPKQKKKISKKTTSKTKKKITKRSDPPAPIYGRNHRTKLQFGGGQFLFGCPKKIVEFLGMVKGEEIVVKVIGRGITYFPLSELQKNQIPMFKK